MSVRFNKLKTLTIAYIHTIKIFSEKNNKKDGWKMTGFFNVFIFHFLQTFGTLKNYSTNVSEDDCVLTADTVIT